MAEKRKKPFSQYDKIHGRPTYRQDRKKPIAEPIHVGHFIVLLVMKICKKILLIDTSVKIGIYVVGVMLGSILCDLFALPPSYFSNKRNLLNVWFVKLGWGWTLLSILPFVFLTSYVYSCGNLLRVRSHCIRIAVASVWWFICTKSFVLIESTIGVCTDSRFTDRQSCLDESKKWLGFEISGHVFLLIHALLTISEEVRVFKKWSFLEKLLQDEDGDLAARKKLVESEVTQAQILYKSLTPYIKLCVLFITFLVVLWEFMLIITVVYRFHTLPHKVVASFIAVGCWFVSYRILFLSQSQENKSDLMPPYPGKSPFNFISSPHITSRP